MKYIENDKLRVGVCEMGAELQSIVRKSDNWEVMWQADAAYWNRHAPILFPLVGHAYEDTFRVDGKAYGMGQHGFARDREFEVVEEKADRLVMRLKSDEASLEVYPFEFVLTISYELVDDKLGISWHVENTGERVMPFHIGAHPGFNLPDYHDEDEVHGYMTFNVKDKLVSAGLKPGGYTDPETNFDVALEGGQLTLTNHTFDCDTILDQRGIVNACTLLDKNHRPVVEVRFDMPILALWSPNGGKAPFVCIEPWYGCCDPYGFKGEFVERPYTTNLEPGETFENRYEVVVS